MSLAETAHSSLSKEEKQNKTAAPEIVSEQDAPIFKEEIRLHQDTFDFTKIKEKFLGLLREPLLVSKEKLIYELGALVGGASLMGDRLDAILLGSLGGYFLARLLGIAASQENFNKMATLYPDYITQKPSTIKEISAEKISAMMSDGVYAVAKHSAHQARPYSLIPHKAEVVEKFAQNIYSGQVKGERGAHEAVGKLMEFFLAAKDPLLKKEILNILKKRDRQMHRHIEDQVQKNEYRSPLEKAVYLLLAERRNIPISEQEGDIKQVFEQLELKNIYANSREISEQLVKKISQTLGLEPTFIPYVRLFVLRRAKEEIANNQLPFSDITQFSTQLENELTRKLQIHNRLENESVYDPESPTIGFEVQPGYNAPLPLKVDYPEIKMIQEYLDLDDSPDLPFEFVLPPTRTPMAQLMMFQELAHVVGFPIDQAAVQINLGGIGRDEGSLKALQRMLFASKRLQENSSYLQRWGNVWDLGSENKGEVNIRERGGSDTATFREITPSDPEHPEFHKVIGEMRLSVEANSMLIFSRGVITMHHLAKMMKAHERKKAGSSLTAQEEAGAAGWQKIIFQFDKLLAKYNLPPIQAKWKTQVWKQFGRVFNNNRKKLRPKMQSIFAEGLKDYSEIYKKGITKNSL